MITSPRIPVRSAAASAADFRQWLRAAQPDDWCIWHVGDTIAIERRQSTKLDELATAVRVFSDLGAINQTTQRMTLAVGPRTVYSATRTRGRRPPAALLMGEIKPVEFYALRALADRDVNSRCGAPRILRDAIAMPEGKARVLLETLAYRGLVARDQIGGWDITPQGRDIIR